MLAVGVCFDVGFWFCDWFALIRLVVAVACGCLWRFCVFVMVNMFVGCCWFSFGV